MCPEESDLPNLNFTVNDGKINVQESDGLKFSSAYKVCIFAGNAGGESDPICKEITTPPIEGND